ncbi:hypothetical protein C8Q73DRAFT_689142 [Cubamyces lactineus]|nr:hypothetical protein C8Q73DRAFT_689142 [Cubamyces lactineus]
MRMDDFMVLHITLLPAAIARVYCSKREHEGCHHSLRHPEETPGSYQRRMAMVTSAVLSPYEGLSMPKNSLTTERDGLSRVPLQVPANPFLYRPDHRTMMSLSYYEREGPKVTGG